MSAAVPDVLLATGLPPGWIELTAFRDEAALRRFLDAQLDADAERYDAEQRERVVGACLTGHRVLEGQGWLHAGGIVTHVPHDGGWLPTVWAVAVGVVPHPDPHDLDLAALAERVLPRALAASLAVDATEVFDVGDGRRGIVLGATMPLPPVDDDLPRLAQLDPQALGVYVCLVPVPGLPDRLGVTIGVAPHRDERAAMSLLAGQMAVSLRVLEDTGALDRDTVLVDTTGAFHPGGSLGTDTDAKGTP